MGRYLGVRKPKPPVKFKGGRGSSSGQLVYSLERHNAVYCRDFRKMVPVQPEDKKRILSLMREDKRALNHTLKVLGKRELADKVAKEGIPKDLYRELFSTLNGTYGVSNWIAEGALREATTIIRQWHNSTFQKGHIPRAKALRLYVPTAWYNPETGYLELPGGLKLKEVGGNWKCNKYPIAYDWVRVLYNPDYEAFFLMLVRKVPLKERKLNVPLSYMVEQGRKRNWVLAVDINVNEIVVGNTKKDLERRYPTLNMAINGLEPSKRPSVLCYGSSPKVCVSLEELRKGYSRLYDSQRKLNEKYPYDLRKRRRGLGRRIRLIIRKMSVIDKLYTKAIAKDIINYALALGSPSEGLPYVIVLENLRGLQERIIEDNDRPRKVKAKISFMAYFKLAKWIITLAKIYGVPYVFVDPKGTSTTCPRCGAKMEQVEDPVIGKRTMYCPNCHFKEDRDTVALINLVKRFLSPHL